jgi:hypothetical protein
MSMNRELDPGVFVLAYQTVVRDYIEPPEQKDYAEGMHEWLRSRPSMWVELEHATDGTAEWPSVITASLRAADGKIASVPLARCGYHPRTLWLLPEGVARLRALLR